ncbi:MAG: hypothetical protein NWS01_07060 [Burkholderiales bacterium]|nr:hypothetical protein [Burkholderiales bacterium]
MYRRLVNFILVLVMLGVTPMLMPSVALAVTDAGTIQRTLPKPEIILPQAEDRTVIEEVAPETTGPTVTLTVIEFEGNTLVTTEALNAVVSPFIGQPLGMAELEELRQVVGEYYRSQGFWASAVYEDQDIGTQRLVITIYEGRVGAIKIEIEEPPLRFPESRAINFIAHTQTPGDPIQVIALDNSVADLDAVPGIAASVELDRGENVGETDIVVKTKNTPYLTGSFKVDNQGSRSTGYNRGTLSANIDSPFKFGEQFNLTYLKAKGVDYFGVAANYPLLDDGTKLTLSYTNMQYELFYPLKDLDASGNAHTYTANLSRNLYREKNGIQLSGALEYGYRDYYNETGLEVVTSDKSIQGWTATLNLQSQDLLLGGGVLIGSLSLAQGRLDQGEYEIDQDAAATQGGYEKMNLNLIRVQQVTNVDTLWLTLTGQMALKNNLDSAEKMSLGGSTGVRAYPASEASGDHGILLKAELRHAFLANLQGTVFYDWGQIYQYKNTWDDWQTDSGSTAPNIYQLKGAGLGLLWQPAEGTELTLDVASKIGNNKGQNANGQDGDGTEWGTRFWVGLTKNF